MGVQLIKQFKAEGGKSSTVEVEIPEGTAQVVLWAQAQVASTNTADFSLALEGEGWTQIGGETLAGMNRRYRGGVWVMEKPAGGTRQVTVVSGRPASLMGFVMALDEPPAVEERRELSVILRPLGPGETHEVRFVRPDELVLKEGGRGIDWGQTAFVGHVFEIEE